MLLTVIPCAANPRCVLFTPNGQQLIYGQYDKIQIHDVRTNALVRTFLGHTGCIFSLAVTSDSQHLVSASYDRTARVWLLDSGAEVHVLKHLGSVHGVVVSPDNQLIVTGTGHPEHAVHVWRMADGSLLRTRHTRCLESVAVSPDGLHVVSGSEDRTQVWLLADGALQREIKHPGWALSVAVTPDSQHIVSGCNDSIVRLFRLASGDLVCEFKGHTRVVERVAVSADGRHVVSGSYDTTVRVWSLADARAPLVLQGHTSSIHSVAFHPNGKQVASTSADTTVRLWTICEWSDRVHQLFSSEFKALVFHLMCIKARLDSEQIITPLLPRLPMAVWLQVFAFLKPVFSAF